MAFPVYLLIIISVFISSTMGYRWSVFQTENVDLCNNGTCGNREHTMCREVKQRPNCTHYIKLILTEEIIRNIVIGHNGLRNKVALNTEHPAGNMNYLHWDRDLQDMAEKSLLYCSLKKEECPYIFNQTYVLGQNLALVKTYNKNRGLPSHVIRDWFREGIDYGRKEFMELTMQNANSFTQMNWGETEFLGCAGAKYDNTYLFSCFYYPAEVIGKPFFKPANPCTLCSDDRTSCSRHFLGLCGLDDKYSNTQSHHQQHHNMLIILFAIMIKYLI